MRMFKFGEEPMEVGQNLSAAPIWPILGFPANREEVTGLAK